IIRKSRYERLVADIIQAGRKTKVLLVSATPVNNDLKDLRNQLYFITEGRDNAFQESMGVANLQETLAAAQRTFNDWAASAGKPWRRWSAAYRRKSCWRWRSPPATISSKRIRAKSDI
ncbi:MAG: hypothetical protein KDF65_03390, partial [Anaerolineae bacterium]|nr:hypothetical protein [Anaerolineae bacterium]